MPKLSPPSSSAEKIAGHAPAFRAGHLPGRVGFLDRSRIVQKGGSLFVIAGTRRVHVHMRLVGPEFRLVIHSVERGVIGRERGAQVIHPLVLVNFAVRQIGRVAERRVLARERRQAGALAVGRRVVGLAPDVAAQRVKAVLEPFPMGARPARARLQTWFVTRRGRPSQSSGSSRGLRAQLALRSRN